MAITVPSYPYVDGDFEANLRKAAWRFRTNLTKRRGTKKTEMVDKYIAAVEGSLEAWPIVPFGYEFEREHVLRVWLQVEGDATQKAPPDAVLFCELPLDLLIKAGLADKNTKQLLLPYLLVPEEYWIWSAGALSFEKVIMTVLQDTVREHALTHKDTEVREELVWIGPVGEEDLMYYFVVLTQVGIRPRIDPKKANQSFFAGVPSVPSVAGIQQMPGTNFIWEWLLRIEAEGIIRRGVLPDGRNGQELLDDLFRDPIINFLRDLADLYQEEEFERMIEDGGFDRGEVHKAVSNGFGQHLPDSGKALREKWLERADAVDLRRAVRAARAFRSYKGAGSAIAHGVGEGWAVDPQVEANRRVLIEFLCSRYGVMAEAARYEASSNDDADQMLELAEKAYLKGDITCEEAVVIGGGGLLLPGDSPDADDPFYNEWLKGFGPKLKYLAEDYPA